jgi:hypothetical protein
LHIVYSQPRGKDHLVHHQVGPWQSLSQFILFGIVIFICFIQPQPLREIINEIIKVLPK